MRLSALKVYLLCCKAYGWTPSFAGLLAFDSQWWLREKWRYRSGR